MSNNKLFSHLVGSIILCLLSITSFPAYAWEDDYYYDSDYQSDYDDGYQYNYRDNYRSNYSNRYDDNDDGDNYSRSSRAFPQKRAATGNRVFIFSPRAHAWGAYDESGNLVRTGRASGGKSYCPDIGRSCKTIVGTYKIFSKGGADCISSRFPVETNGGAPMPYCMHFHGGYAIHGSNAVPGYNASHGCIRVPHGDAMWLNHSFARIGTTVIVMPY